MITDEQLARIPRMRDVIRLANLEGHEPPRTMPQADAAAMVWLRTFLMWLTNELPDDWQGQMREGHQSLLDRIEAMKAGAEEQ